MNAPAYVENKNPALRLGCQGVGGGRLFDDVLEDVLTVYLWTTLNQLLLLRVFPIPIVRGLLVS